MHVIVDETQPRPSLFALLGTLRAVTVRPWACVIECGMSRQINKSVFITHYSNIYNTCGGEDASQSMKRSVIVLL